MIILTVVAYYLAIALTFMYLLLRNYKQNKDKYEPTTELDIYKTFGVCFLWPLSVCFGIIRLVAEALADWTNKD